MTTKLKSDSFSLEGGVMSERAQLSNSLVFLFNNSLGYFVAPVFVWPVAKNLQHLLTLEQDLLFSFYMKEMSQG
ncbi:MAG: hypothetical protein FJ267_03730, partial [Planctomycetes bacterium]|nr:hypothetical protein [Planctomycetota bacterium]